MRPIFQAPGFPDLTFPLLIITTQAILLRLSLRRLDESIASSKAYSFA